MAGYNTNEVQANDEPGLIEVSSEIFSMQARHHQEQVYVWRKEAARLETALHYANTAVAINQKAVETLQGCDDNAEKLLMEHKIYTQRDEPVAAESGPTNLPRR